MKKINVGILTFFLSIALFGALLFKPSYAQTEAALLPNAVQQYFDNSGNPLTSGKVYFYEVGTTTFKDTYTSSAATTVNTNPITLNAGGKAPTGGIYGIGLYRQIVRDRNGNLIWDAVTEPGAGSADPTAIGDGNLVGTVLPWSGLIAPNQYLFAYGQEISRTNYDTLFTAITQKLNVSCSSGSNTLTGIIDTSQIRIGSAIELALCVPAGTTVVSKTTTTVLLSNPSSVSINSLATFFPWGSGNGTTTFNIPDLRGYVIAGRDNMGGTASSRLTTLYYGSDPAALGATGGSQSHVVQFPQVLVAPGALSGNSLTQATINSVQPTVTLNYIIKVTPDISSSDVTGVAAISGMTGVITCGSGLTCTGNIISVISPSTISLSVVGTGWGLTGGPCTTTCTVSVATTNPAFQYGNPVNLQLNASVASNSLTIAIKGNDGNNPSTTNPVLIPYRNVTASTGSVTWLAQTAALSTDIISGATLGTSNATSFRYWIAAANDAGVTRLCAINTLISTNVYSLSSNGNINGSTPAGNSGHTWYCNASVSNRPYTLLGYVTYEGGLATAGLYTSIPNTIQMYGPGVKLPGDVIQTVNTPASGMKTGVTQIPFDISIPQLSEGNEYIRSTISPNSGANLLEIDSSAMLSSSGNVYFTIALFKNANLDAVAANGFSITSTQIYPFALAYTELAGVISGMTYKLHAGGNGAGTTTFNGVGGAMSYGNTAGSYLRVREIMR